LKRLSVWKSALLGVVQGLTEFLPISSTAHLQLASRALKLSSPGIVLETSLHLGTLLATGLWLGQQEREAHFLNFALLAKVALATLPAALAGFLLENWIQRYLRGPQVTGLMLILGGLGLGWAEQRGSQHKDLSQLSYADAGYVGCAQMLALVPGLSRSGMTLAAGLWRGLSQKESLRLSFLLSVPVIAGSGLLKLKQLGRQRQVLQTLLAGGLSAALTGYVCLDALFHALQGGSLRGFVWYRGLLGAGHLVLAGTSSRT